MKKITRAPGFFETINEIIRVQISISSLIRQSPAVQKKILELHTAKCLIAFSVSPLGIKPSKQAMVKMSVTCFQCKVQTDFKQIFLKNGQNNIISKTVDLRCHIYVHFLFLMYK